MSTPAYIARRNQGATNEQFLARTEALERTVDTYTLLTVMDSGNVGLTTGVKGDVQLHKRFSIQSWTLLADQVGSIVVDVWKTPYASYPPTDANSITNGFEPEISGDDKATDLVRQFPVGFSEWSTRIIDPGDTLRFNIDSVSAIARVTLAIELIG